MSAKAARFQSFSYKSIPMPEYSEKRNVLSLHLKEERVAECLMPWGKYVPDVGTEVCERTKAVGFVVEALEFEHACAR